MGFVAAEAVSELEYDFTGMVDGQRRKNWPVELHDVKGVSPEPSQDQVRDMYDAIRKLYSLGEYAEPDEMKESVAKSLSLTEIKDRDLQIAKIYADACSQEPTTEQILLLPHRSRAAYIGYLSGELLTPTAGSPATSSSRAPLKSV